MISEAVENPVPERREHRDEQCFTERDPDVIYNQVTAPEIIERKIVYLVDGLGMLQQAAVEHIPGRFSQSIATLARSCGNCLPHVDW